MRTRLAIYSLLAMIFALMSYFAMTDRHAPAPTETSAPSSR